MRRSFALVMLAGLAVPAVADDTADDLGVDTQSVAGDEDPQRYTMSETADGFLRLDRNTGSVSLCKGSKAGEGEKPRWSCVPVPDAQIVLDREAEALERDNKRLTARVDELEQRLRDIARSAETEFPKADKRKPGGGKQDKPGELSPKEERQIDRFMDFSEHAMRRFFGFMKTLRDEYDKGI